MKLRDYLNDLQIDEAAAGKDMDKLVDFLKRAATGAISQAGMIGYGFNLRSPAANNEEQIVPTLAQKLRINITKEDLMAALKEAGMKSASEVVQRWARSKTGASQTRTARTSREGTAGKEQF